MVKIAPESGKPLIQKFYDPYRECVMHKCCKCKRMFREDYFCNIHIKNQHPELRIYIVEPKLGLVNWLGGLLTPKSPVKFERKKRLG